MKSNLDDLAASRGAELRTKHGSCGPKKKLTTAGTKHPGISFAIVLVDSLKNCMYHSFIVNKLMLCYF